MGSFLERYNDSANVTSIFFVINTLVEGEKIMWAVINSILVA